MIDLNISYQASLFGDFTAISVTPDCTFKLMSLFKDFGFIPNTFYEFQANFPLQTNSPISNPVNSQINTLRPLLQTVNNEWSINIGSNRIDVTKIIIDKYGKNMGHIESFINNAIRYITILCNEFGIKSNRLALNTNGLITSKTINFNSIANPIDFYEKVKPKEWNIRMVSRDGFQLGSLNESVNIITSIINSNVNVIINNEFTKFDGIQVQFDINTVPENIIPRFDSLLVNFFFKKVFDFRETLLNQIKEKYLNE